MKFFPIKGGINPGTDLNTIGGAGIYNLSGEYTNAPFSQSWGNLIVFSDGSNQISFVRLTLYHFLLLSPLIKIEKVDPVYSVTI